MASLAAMQTENIDLDRFRTPGVEVFTGRDRGKLARIDAHLDDLDRRDVHVRINIPADVYLLASSFWLGMFGPSVRTLGEHGFREKYEFVGEDLDAIVEDGIREALKYSSPLPQSKKR